MRRILVIGAGAVGTCCALYLQRAGFAVSLVDRDAPGAGCSAGNSGGFGYASCVPAAVPGLRRRAPAMLFDRESPVTVRWRDLTRTWPFLLRVLANARPDVAEASADARHALQRHLFDAYAPLLEAAGAGHLVEREGLLLVYETDEGLAAARYALEMRRRRGIAVEAMSGDEARELEPALSPTIRHAVMLPQVGHTTDPLLLVRTLAEHFVRGGGKLLRARVHGFEIAEDGPGAALSDAGRHEAEQFVIAAGAWSASLAAGLGVRVPLVAERGYHVELSGADVRFRRPINAPERHVVLTSMRGGLRVTGIAEFASPDALPDFRHARRILRHARALAPAIGDEEGVPWMGPRPSLPDSLPIIDRAPRHPNVLLAFGHDQVGLALAAITGKLVAELAQRRRPSVDLAPYRADRF